MNTRKKIVTILLICFFALQNFGQNNRNGYPAVLHQPPEVDFSWVNACVGDTTIFINGSIRGTFYQWYIYDKKMNKLDSSTNFNIAYLFPAADTFFVFLQADNGHIASSSQMVIIDTVLTCDFNFMHCSNQFINHSTCATSFFWDFGDGSTSTLDVPNHQYADTGSYTVKFKASKGIYSDSVTKQIYVDPIAFPTGAITYYLSNDTLFFHAVDSSAGIFYNWNFGDFTPHVYKRDSFHVYTNPGTYILNFSDWNTCNTAYGTDTIVILPLNSIPSISLSNSSASIFPNPVSSNTDLNFIYNGAEQKSAHLKLSNVFGQVIFEKDCDFKTGRNEFKISTEGFSTGMYFIGLIGNKVNNKIKFLVE